MSAAYRYEDEPGHRSASNENERRVGTNFSELPGGAFGIFAFVLVVAPVAGLSPNRSSAKSEHSLGDNILT